MSIENYYTTLKLYEQDNTEFSATSGQYVFKRTFQGLIQAPSPRNTFTNGKDTSDVSAVLFCPVTEIFTSTDGIGYENSTSPMYKVPNSNTQPQGVTGIKSHHSQYNLQYIGTV